LTGGLSAIGSARCLALHGRWNYDHIASGAEDAITSVPVIGGRQAVMTKLKSIVDPAVIAGAQLSDLKRCILAFPSLRRLVRRLGSVVEPAAPTVFNAGEDLVFGSSIAAQLIGDDHSRNLARIASRRWNGRTGIGLCHAPA